MDSLAKPLRRALERTVIEARDVAEQAAQAALHHLGVGESEAPAHLTEDQRTLRRRLRAHGRQLGDHRRPDGQQAIDHLVQETAYEHWHRMLFARFLAENHLLMHPDGVPLSLAECDELAPDEDAANGWELAGRYASRMLPQIFRPDSPVLALDLPPEHQRALERLLAGLDSDTFQAQDSLGWVYQFWQSKKKDEVNRSEVKIGADELPAVTQLFTEPYMVSFLLDNSLGAWWVANHPDKPCPVSLTYLRTVEVATASSRCPEKRQDGASTGYLQKNEPIATYAGNLPHWRQEGVTYFVTFRTADSFPQNKLEQWRKARQTWLDSHPEPHDGVTRREYRRLFNTRLEYWLDQGYGECRLADAANKEIVEGALRFFDGKRYHLGEHIVMPNHVHVLVTPIGEHQLSEILHSWKSFTATRINKREGRTGPFWQKEYFDHIVRGPEQTERIILYIKQNPLPKNDIDTQRLYEETFCQVETASSRFENSPNMSGERQDGASTNQVETTSSRFQDSLSIFEKRLEGASTIPAAGRFEAWPKDLSELKVMDPCCGSGHFLVATLLMLAPMRMMLEGLSAREAVDRVLAENIHGLELDQRCVELAAFNLALTAWRYPDAGGYRSLPELQVACSGLSVSAAKEEWKQLAMDKHNLRIALDWMHDTFRDAPVLGSLLNPAKTDAAKIVRWEELSEALERALGREGTEEQREAGVVAQGLARAAVLLGGRYQLVVTNVPYLTRGKQGGVLRDFSETRYPAAKNDLATVFLERCLEFCIEGGTTSIVLPQNWLFLTSYRGFREKLLKKDSWHLIGRLGAGAFETISGEVVKAILIILSRERVEEASSLFKRQDAASTLIRGVDVSEPRNSSEKATGLLTAELKSVEQAKQLGNPDARISLEDASSGILLEKLASNHQGLSTGDNPRFRRFHWEVNELGNDWAPEQSTVDQYADFGGRSGILLWQNGCGQLWKFGRENVKALHNVDRRGEEAWGRNGIGISQMRELPTTLYKGEKFDTNMAVISPNNPAELTAIWCLCSSPEYNKAVRQIDQSLKVTNATLVKVPFDLDHWTKIAQQKYPNGLPKPYTDDPTQWIYHGHPCGSVVWNEQNKRLEVASTRRTDASVLQVGIARLLGYRWPAEVEAASSRFDTSSKRLEGASTELSEESRTWVTRCKVLDDYVDDDGIVCLPTLRGEKPAAERLRDLLQAAYGDEWTAPTLNRLLADANAKGKGLDWWLREKFFEQHCKLFQHRPFIWQIWDGLKDGFAALVNYHKLDHKTLETLIYTYLGDWIGLQERGANDGVDGAQERLTAARDLKRRLELILEGEAPYDIFVRWKPLEQQPLGWNPDLNDGVRLNIRPFVTAGVLRHHKKPKLNVHWNKDRGKDVPSAPWRRLGLDYGGKEGDRINDHHLSLAEKQAAREAAGDRT
jgi:REP element-mobilizing transposase RayT